MNNIRTFIVVPSLPAPLEKLRELAHNLWWAWNPQAIELFRRLDFELWERVGHNPVALLAEVGQQRLEQAAGDSAYLTRLARITDALALYMQGSDWYRKTYPEHADDTIAYFSAEFGLHECLPVYSGGLGMLAGDHLKSASDLGLPLVAVGLAYRQGYFTQQLAGDGWQIDSYPTYDFHHWPATLVKNADGDPLRIELPLGADTLYAHVFQVNVGRVKLFLLDSDLTENRADLRSITSRLYDSAPDARIRQEVLLGIGGLRALRAMGIQPIACHMNEGHSAFLALERMRHLMQTENLSFSEAREAVFSGGVFTTHTPVPAGIDTFDDDLVRKYLGRFADEGGISMDDVLALGREHPRQKSQPFSMAVLALRTAYCINGVSKLHAEVARGMWRGCWPDLPRDEVPITHITNGIHTPTWISPQMAELFDQYLGPDWSADPSDGELWKRVEEIPDAELWRVHERRRERLIAVVRQRMRTQLERRGAPAADIQSATEILNPRTLTIGYARRFAPYKRATLILRDLERLASIINDSERPVQFVFAGKAHPNDDAGKELLKQVMTVCHQSEFRGRLVFLENYEMSLARDMVHGVDVWLNNPLRLHEASGTSGMKVVANGGLHLSCLDGWWPEGFDGRNGWAIGDTNVYDDPAYRDYVDSRSLYSLLEREIVPLYYDRGADHVPHKWIARMKHSMRSLCPVFNTHRMVRAYCRTLYLPAIERYNRFAADHYQHARDVTALKTHLAASWHDIRITAVESSAASELRVGDSFSLSATVQLGSIDPADVCVEVYHGRMLQTGEISDGARLPMAHAGSDARGHIFTAEVPCHASGQNGYAVRVLPRCDGQPDPRDPGLILWG